MRLKLPRLKLPRLKLPRWVGRLLLTLLGVSLITFVLMEMTPGDPAEILLSSRYESPTPEAVAAARREMGLDAPFWHRYIRWLGKALRLDLGVSRRTGDPVIRELTRRIPATLALSFTTLVFVMIVSLTTGLAAALRKERSWNTWFRFWVIPALVIPDYWLGMILTYVFSVNLGWFPVMGAAGPTSIVLPTVTLGLSLAAVHGQVFRASLLEVMGSDHVRFAQGKGLSPFSILRRHVIPAALPPVLTLWGMSFGHLLGGSVIVETVFAWPGIGKLTADAVLERDFPLVQGAVLFMTLVFVLVNRCVDVLQGLLEAGNDDEFFT